MFKILFIIDMVWYGWCESKSDHYVQESLRKLNNFVTVRIAEFSFILTFDEIIVLATEHNRINNIWCEINVVLETI